MTQQAQISVSSPGNGDTSELWDKAQKADVQTAPPPINCHIHLPPNFSSFDKVDDAFKMADEEGIRILATSNYYDFSVYEVFAREAETRNILPIFGTEIIARDEELLKNGIRVNDPGNPGKIYICGKGIVNFQNLKGKAATILETIRSNDSARMREMIAKLSSVVKERGVSVMMSEDSVKGMIANRSGAPWETIFIQERHIARALQEEVFQFGSAERKDALDKLLGEDPGRALDNPTKIQDEIRSKLLKAGKPAFVPETYVTLEESIELILGLGGMPSYPVLADGTDPICEYESSLNDLIGHLRKSGIHAAEFIPLRNDPEVLQEYVKGLRGAGFVVAAGTEHNTVACPPLKPTCRGGKPIPKEVEKIFFEGACVAVAHQFLTMNGNTGFVDSKGTPNTQFENAEERITAFARLGAYILRESTP